MCRLRLPGGIVRDWQLQGLAAISEEIAGGSVDVTTRANLQIREIAARHGMETLYRLRELDLITTVLALTTFGILLAALSVVLMNENGLKRCP